MEKRELLAVHVICARNPTWSWSRERRFRKYLMFSARSFACIAEKSTSDYFYKSTTKHVMCNVGKKNLKKPEINLSVWWTSAKQFHFLSSPKHLSLSRFSTTTKAIENNARVIPQVGSAMKLKLKKKQPKQMTETRKQAENSRRQLSVFNWVAEPFFLRFISVFQR